MPSEKAHAVIKAQRRYVYAILLSLILLLPVAEAATTKPVSFHSAAVPAQMQNLTVSIVQPLPNTTYVQGSPRKLFSALSKNDTSFIYGPIKIIANVTGGTNVSLIEFFVDGISLEKVTNITGGPYNMSWAPRISIGRKGLKHTITVIAYDATGNASASINVTKWRFHVAPLVLLAAAMAPLLLPRTTIRGLVFNMHKNLLGYSFFAIRVHYRSVSIFKRDSGTIFMKRVRVGPALSMHMFNFSPLKLARISSTFLGTFA
jgi:hypothetical protein